VRWYFEQSSRLGSGFASVDEQDVLRAAHPKRNVHSGGSAVCNPDSRRQPALEEVSQEHRSHTIIRAEQIAAPDDETMFSLCTHLTDSTVSAAAANFELSELSIRLGVIRVHGADQAGVEAPNNVADLDGIIRIVDG